MSYLIDYHVEKLSLIFLLHFSDILSPFRRGVHWNGHEKILKRELEKKCSFHFVFMVVRANLKKKNFAQLKKCRSEGVNVSSFQHLGKSI